MFGKAIVGGFFAGVLVAGVAMADTFGTGANQFTIDFVGVSGATNPTSGYGIVNHDYRIGTCEITNDQWNKFEASLGIPVTGSQSSSFTGLSQPTGNVSWFEAAQFVNWLNTNTGHQAAYKFTGTQGTGDYTFAPWSTTDAGYDVANPFRNKNAKYFLPTEDEWVKAAYWNGTALQTWATVGDVFPEQGDGTSATGWNYDAFDGKHSHYATNPPGPWSVGSGGQELNGTYDMMGNDWEWMESPETSGDYDAISARALRGGSWGSNSDFLGTSAYRYVNGNPWLDPGDFGFRVASIPEPGSIILLLSAGAISLFAYAWRRRRQAA